MKTYAFVVLFAIVGCTAQTEPKNYDDCVLVNLRNAKTEAAISSVRSSCANKHAPSFNWDEIARKSGTTTWTTIVNSQEFKKLSKDDQRAVKEDYWMRVIEPTIRSEFKEVANRKFLANQ